MTDRAVTDRELAAGWDAAHRQAATVTFFAGLVIILGCVAWFGSMEAAGAMVDGQRPSPFLATLIAGILLIVDVGLLVFVVGLAHAFSSRSFALALTAAVATLTTTTSAALHLLWGYAVATPEVALQEGAVEFLTWLALNIWLMPLFGLLVGATLLALGFALRGSDFRLARRLGLASLIIGALLVALAPFTGFSPEQSPFVAVAAILVSTGGIGALVLVALVRIGALLWRTRRPAVS